MRGLTRIPGVRDLAAGLARGVARVFGAGVHLRNHLYDSGRLPVGKLPRPVVSIGNLSIGGTGKTPITEELARLLSEEGYLTCILSRGHGGRRDDDPLVVSDLVGIRRGPVESGDEPFLLARRLPGVPVVVGKSRLRAGLLALSEFRVHVFLLDDGFQHRQLHRDLDLVLLPAADPWGGGDLLPAGRLREGPEALARAGAVVLTDVQRTDPDGVAAAVAEVEGRRPGLPVLLARSRPTAVRHLPSGPIEPLATVRGLRVLALAGIARPNRFFADVEAAGAILAGRRTVPDHHPHSAADLRSHLRAAEDVGAAAVITTEKDAVRLPPPPRHSLPIMALRVQAAFDDPQAVLAVLARALPPPSRGGRVLG